MDDGDCIVVGLDISLFEMVVYYIVVFVVDIVVDEMDEKVVGVGFFDLYC